MGYSDSVKNIKSSPNLRWKYKVRTYDKGRQGLYKGGLKEIGAISIQFLCRVEELEADRCELK